MAIWRQNDNRTLIYLTAGFAVGFFLALELFNFSRSTRDLPQAWREERRRFIKSYGYDKEDTSVADHLTSEVTVLCYVVLPASDVQTKRKVYMESWAPRCDAILLFSETKSDDETIILNSTSWNTSIHENSKVTYEALRYIYKNHLTHAQWFIRLHPMTFLIVENLRFFLYGQNHTRPVYFGEFLEKSGFYYPLGSGGYVISRGALELFGRNSLKEAECRPHETIEEDVFVGECFHRLGIKAGISKDPEGRNLFNGYPLELISMKRYPQWYLENNPSQLTTKGIDAVSPYAITICPVQDDVILALEYLVYHTQIYGRLPPKMMSRDCIQPMP